MMALSDKLSGLFCHLIPIFWSQFQVDFLNGVWEYRATIGNLSIADQIGAGKALPIQPASLIPFFCGLKICSSGEYKNNEK